MEHITLDDIPVVNCAQYLLDRMKAFEDKPAMVAGETGATMTYKQLIERTRCAAAGLQQFGANADDVICIVSPNHVDYMVAFYASTLIYTVFQPINPLQTEDDMKRSMDQCGTKFVMTIPALLDKVKHAIAYKNIKIIVFGESDEYTTFDSLVIPGNDQYNVPERDPRTATAALMSSSGTTGFPKPVMITHYNIVCNTIQQRCSGLQRGQTTYVVFLPMFHAFGLYMVTYFVHHKGARAVVMTRFQSDEFLRIIQEYKPTSLHVVPPIMVMLSKYPKVSEYDLSSVKSIVCGAAPLSKEIGDHVQNRLNLEHIHQGYGMTEIGVTHLFTSGDSRYQSAGRLLPLIEMKIVDVETEEVLGPNKEGEIWIRGPQTCKGYLGLPEENARLVTDDGWFRTGDVGKEDEDGYLYIVDRMKELIKYKGFQVAPATLEDIIHGHASVADVGVVGMPDEEAGELPRAYVVLKPGASVTEEELVDYVSGRVAPYMKLRGGVKFVTEIPRTLSGKILRKNLREDARQFAANKTK